MRDSEWMANVVGRRGETGEEHKKEGASRGNTQYMYSIFMGVAKKKGRVVTYM